MGDRGRGTWAVLDSVLIAFVGIALATWLQGGAGAIVGSGVLGGALGGVLGAFAPNILDAFRARIDADTAAKALEGPEPTFVSANGAPSDLLHPRHAVARFQGRERELTELTAWCTNPTAPKVRMICGPGGIGKSRLARKFGLDMEKTHRWQCVFVDDGQEAQAVKDARRRWPKRPVLLIVDYAETRTGLVELLRQVADDFGVIRVLLLARSAGGWWDDITAGLAVRELLRGADVDTPLPEKISTNISNEQIARDALGDFAKKLNTDEPQNVEFVFGSTQPRVLELHAAALVAVLDARRLPAGTPVQVDVRSVLSELLEHEQRFWLGRADTLALTTGPDGVGLAALRQLVAAASLLGAHTDGELAGLITRVPSLVHSSEPRREKLTAWLTELYPPDTVHGEAKSRPLGVLQPDILAEFLITQELDASAPLAESCLTRLTRRQAIQATTVLARASTDHPEAASLVEAALRSEVDGAPASGLLADAEADLQDLMAIERAIPYPSISLAQTDAALTKRIVDALPSDTPHAERARWLLTLSMLQSASGNPADALPVGEQATAICRDLAEAHPDRYRPDLAASLTNLGVTYWELGRPTDALAAEQEATAIRRELAEAYPDRYRPDLAHSLTNLAIWYSELGRPADAARARAEAEVLESRGVD